MKKFKLFKIGMFTFLFMIVYLNFSTYSNVFISKKLQNVKSVITETPNIKAISTDDGIMIDYNLVKKGNAFVIITDMLGNQLKIVKLQTSRGKINLNKSDLEKAGGKNIFNCIIQIDGSQLMSQQVVLNG